MLRETCGSQFSPAGAPLPRRHDSWGASVEQVVTQIDGAPLGPFLPWRSVRTARSTLPWSGRKAEQGWKAPCAPSCWPTPEQVRYTFMIPLPAPWSRWWAALPERPALRWTSAPRPSTSPTSAAAASERGGLCPRLTAGARAVRAASAGCRAIPARWRWMRTAPLHQLPLGQLQLAGAPCRQHLPARCGPAAERIDAGEPVLLPADGIRAEAVSTASGSWLWSFSGKPQGSSSALCPVENRVYFGIAEKSALFCTGLNRSITLRVPAPLLMEAPGIPENCCKRLGPIEHRTSGHRSNRSIRGN